MRIAILESIVMPAGHEVEFDRILVEGFKKQGHEPIMLVPEDFPFKLDYKTKVEYLEGGRAVSYAGVSKLKKLFLTIVREWRRLAWYSSAFSRESENKWDAILIPTATWRNMRAVRHSPLRDSKIPVLFIFHGINPGERGNFIKAVRSVKEYRNIHIAVLGLQTEFSELADCPNLHTILPPVYLPFDLNISPEFEVHNPLRLGFFGQYRKEKNLEFLLKAFCKANFVVPVHLLVQGATPTPADSAEFERLAKKYGFNKDIRFLHKNLIGIEWQQYLMDSDILLMPYGAERYRYHWSAMLFTAIGFHKPILQSAEINPEVLREFNIGEAVKLDSIETFSGQLENFVNAFREKAEEYKVGLLGANEKYSHKNLIENIVRIFRLA